MEASVAVNQPLQMPPTMMTMVIRLGMALTKYFQRMLQGILGSMG